MFATRLFRLLVLSTLWLLATPVFASLLLLSPDAKIKAGHPDTYVVRQGDTLWAVAELFIENPWQEAANWTQRTPEVYPGDRVSLVPMLNEEGARVLTNQMGLQIKRGREVKLSPGLHVPRDQPAIEILPFGAIRQFLQQPQVLAAGELDDAPYIVTNTGQRLLIGPGSKIYVRGLDNVAPATRYRILRQGQVYRDPDSGQVLAYEAEYLGEAELEKDGEPATLNVITAERSIRDGDRLLPSSGRSFERDFELGSPQYVDNCQIIAVVDGVSQIGQHQIVVLNRGERDNLRPGHVLAVYRGGKTIEDPFAAARGLDKEVTLPSEKIGTLMIFSLFDDISYALVMKATDSIHLHDRVDVP
jgi:hypothetical protein